ncbi:Protein SST2 [Yarrowia sp. B02]|nr:Protein SST2 [Yarrowia sp. B02]
MKCNISEARAQSLLAQFMVARLIHCPEDRTRDSPAQNVPLQPTAKGVYVLSQYLQANSAPGEKKHAAALLSSNHNTMACISLARDSNDAIQTSKYLTLLLFQRLAGKYPNVYTANDIGDLPDGKASPYHHRYFTHPDSDAVTQYYVSRVGVRLLEASVDGHTVYYFSGKAVWQWVMECCEVVSGVEIVDILQEFLSAGFIQHFDPEFRDSEAPKEFVCSKTAKYTFTVSGMSVAGWTSNLPTTPLSSGFPKFVKSRVLHGVELTKDDLVELQEIEHETNTTLDAKTGRPVDVTSDVDIEASRKSREQRLLGFKHENPSLTVILQDPGLTMLFKGYLEDTHCVENHVVYVSTSEAIKCYAEVSQQVSHDSLVSLLTLIYSTYDSYLSPQAPKEFNMISTWRDELCQLTERLRGASTVPESLVLVTEIVRIFELIKNHAFRMMEIDSLPRFLECREYRRCLRTFRWLERDKYV